MLQEPLISDSQKINSLPRRAKGYLFGNQIPQILTQDIPPFRALRLALHRRHKQKRFQEVKDIQRPIEKKSGELSGGEAEILAFYDGVDFVTGNLWLLLFWPIFTYDLINYLNPDNHYAMTLPDLLLGMPNNDDYHHISLSVNLGGDMPRFWKSYYPWAWILGGAILSGYLFRNLSRHDKDLVVDDFNEKETRSHAKKIYQDLLLTLPYSCEYWSFQRRKRHLIEYDFEQKEEKDHQEEKEKLYAEYKDQALQFPRLASALQLAKELDIDDIVSRGLFRILILINHRSYFAWKLGVDTLAEIALYRHDQIGQFALETLIEFSGKNPYIHYRLWSIGQSQNGFAHLLGYAGVTPVRLYSRFRWWMLMITKIIGTAFFLKDLKECRDQNKILHFDSARGQDVCTPCDENFVDPERQETGQGCVDGLSSSPRSSSQFLNSLSAVQMHGPFTIIDASQQSWSAWPISDWKRFIELLNSGDFRNVSTLNLSRSTPGTLPVTPDYLTVLADYLKTASIRHLILSGQMINTQGMTALLPGLSTTYCRIKSFCQWNQCHLGNRYAPK